MRFSCIQVGGGPLWRPPLIHVHVIWAVFCVSCAPKSHMCMCCTCCGSGQTRRTSQSLYARCEMRLSLQAREMKTHHRGHALKSIRSQLVDGIQGYYGKGWKLSEFFFVTTNIELYVSSLCGILILLPYVWTGSQIIFVWADPRHLHTLLDCKTNRSTTSGPT